MSLPGSNSAVRPPARAARATPVHVAEATGVAEAKKARVVVAGDVAGDECRYCSKKGHWARECCKEKDEQSHAAQVDEGELALLVVAVLEEVHLAVHRRALASRLS
jgi:hypothetical protein